MKTKQEQISGMAQDIYVCKNCHIAPDCDESCGCYWEASRYYKKGYRKASDIIDEFVERLEKYVESRNDLWDEDRPEFDEEFVKFGIQIVADEMRQEVEK